MYIVAGNFCIRDAAQSAAEGAPESALCRG